MYVLFTKKDLKESTEYLEKRLARELCVKIDIVFEEKLNTLQELLNSSKLLKDIDKAGASFKSYQNFQAKEIKDYEKKPSSLSMNIFSEHIDTYASIFKSLSGKNIAFEVRIYE